jgi:hypothetical protein
LEDSGCSLRKILTSVSRSEEEMVEEVGEPVSKVLNEIDPDKSRFLTNPTLAFSGLNPKGHPSSCFHIKINKSTHFVNHYSVFVCARKRERQRYLLSHDSQAPQVFKGVRLIDILGEVQGGHLRERMNCHSTIIH